MNNVNPLPKLSSTPVCVSPLSSHARLLGGTGGWLLLALVLSAGSQAQDLIYTNINGAITITGYAGPGGAVTIPSTIAGVPVVTIGSFSFQSASVASVTIPDSVTTIGELAFEGCTNLSSVTIGKSVTSIGFAAFVGCARLTSVTIPDSVLEIKDGAAPIGGAFAFCGSLTNVTIGNSVTNIGDFAFLFTSLTSIAIPNSVARIGSEAFRGCVSLSTVALGRNVQVVGEGAFNGCALTNVVIPSSVTNIGEGAFGGRATLLAITVDALNTAYQSVDGVVLTKDGTGLIAVPDGSRGSYIIPNSVTSIGGLAFAGCTGLTSVTLDQSVTNIGDSAFWGCVLTNVTIPSSVQSISDSAFSLCTNLTSVTIPGAVTSLGNFVFNGCDSLGGIYFGGNPPSIPVFGALSAYDAIVYYLPGTTGWGATFGGSHTALWNPQMPTNDGSFGVRLDRFGFHISGSPDIPLVIEASSDLAARSWIPLQSCTLTNGSIYFSDSQWPSHPARFYRVRSP